MAGSQTLRFDVVGDASSAARAFKSTADGAALAARASKQFSDSLGLQSKSARVSADATLALAKSDSVLRDAQLTLAGATDDASGSLGTLRRRLDELNGKTAAARVSLAGDKEAQARLDAISARLTDLDHKTSTPTLDIQGIARATAELSAVDVALDKVGGRGGSAAGAASSLGNLSSVAMPALIGSAVALSPVIVTAGIGIGGFAAGAAGAVKPILDAAQATSGLKGNLQTLNPEQQQAARGLLALETQYNSFSKALEPEVLTVFNKGLGLTSGLLGDVEPVAAATGKALGGVLGQVDAEFKSQNWQNFFGFMARTAGPDVEQLGGLIVSLTADLPPLLEDLQPVAVGFLGLATDTAKAVGALENFEHIAQQANHLADQSQKSGGDDPFSLGSIASDAKNAGEQLLNSLYPGFSKVTDQAGKFAKSQGDAAAASAKNTEAVRQQAAAQQAAVTAATDLSTNLTTLEAKYGLTAGQAQALVTAAGQTDKALQGSGDSARSALSAIEKYATASLNAKSPTQQLAGAVSTLDNNTLGATLQLDAFTAAWNIIVGNSVSDQQAILNTAQAFEGYSSAVKTSGKNSTAAQQAFLSIVTAMGTGLSTLQKNGATVGQLNSFYQTNIARLNALHGLTPAQRKDVQDITHDYDVWANSTQGLNGKLLTAAGTVKNNFTANLKALGEFTPRVTGDVNNFANSVLKSGTQSSATRNDRAKLIADLEKAGLSADRARQLVNKLQGQINALKGKTVTVGVKGTGGGGVSIAGQNIPGAQVQQILLRGLAAGGRVPGAGNRDSVPAVLTPGEVVVPKAMVAAGAVDHLRGRLPGFAAGGLVGFPGAAASAASRDAGLAMLADAGRAVAALKKAAAAAGSPVPYSRAAGVTQWEPDVSRVLGMLGLPQADLPTVMSQIQTESGGNPNAINLTDVNAQRGDPSKGLLQVISETFAAYRSPSLSANIYDPLANIYAGLNYAVHRYGNPGWLGVLGHGHGYASGTNSAAPGLALVGERGPELVSFRGGEQVIPAQFLPGGRGGGDVHVHLHNEGVIGSQHELERWLLEANRKLARTKGGGSVQTAFGRS